MGNRKATYTKVVNTLEGGKGNITNVTNKSVTLNAPGPNMSLCGCGVTDATNKLKFISTSSVCLNTVMSTV